MQAYIGVTMLEAKPMTKGEYIKQEHREIPGDPCDPGYLVKTPDGYWDWVPKDYFEEVYFPLEDPTKISLEDIDRMLSLEEATQIDEKTTLVKANTKTGFVQYEPSSCVDPANYDHDIGIQVGMERIKERVWPFMGFVLSWGRFGLKEKK